MCFVFWCVFLPLQSSKLAAKEEDIENLTDCMGHTFGGNERGDKASLSALSLLQVGGLSLGNIPCGLPCGSDSKGSACTAGDLSLILELGRSPGKGMATQSSILA